MTPLTAIVSNDPGHYGELAAESGSTAIDLLIQLTSIDLQGRQMFERDCLGFCFECWLQVQAGAPVPEMERVTSADVLADISDIRRLHITHSDEICEVNPELLAVAAEIETYVSANSPTLQ